MSNRREMWRDVKSGEVSRYPHMIITGKTEIANGAGTVFSVDHGAFERVSIPLDRIPLARLSNLRRRRA